MYKKLEAYGKVLLMPHRFIGPAPDENNGFPFYFKRSQFNSPIASYNLTFRVFFYQSRPLHIVDDQTTTKVRLNVVGVV